VWGHTIRAYKDMVAAEGWSDRSRTIFDEPIVQRLTFKLALLIIAICGFGFDSLSWNDPPKDANTEMSVQECLRIVSHTSVLALIMPKWLWKLPIGW
jgi:hypothetical protein